MIMQTGTDGPKAIESLPHMVQRLRPEIELRPSSVVRAEETLQACLASRPASLPAALLPESLLLAHVGGRHYDLGSRCAMVICEEGAGVALRDRFTVACHLAPSNPDAGRNDGGPRIDIPNDRGWSADGGTYRQVRYRAGDLILKLLTEPRTAPEFDANDQVLGYLALRDMMGHRCPGLAEALYQTVEGDRAEQRLDPGLRQQALAMAAGLSYPETALGKTIRRTLELSAPAAASRLPVRFQLEPAPSDAAAAVTGNIVSLAAFRAEARRPAARNPASPDR